MSAPILFQKTTPSRINLIKNAKHHFLLLIKFKNTKSAQLCKKLQQLNFFFRKSQSNLAAVLYILHI